MSLNAGAEHYVGLSKEAARVAAAAVASNDPRAACLVSRITQGEVYVRVTYEWRSSKSPSTIFELVDVATGRAIEYFRTPEGE